MYDIRLQKSNYSVEASSAGRTAAPLTSAALSAAAAATSLDRAPAFAWLAALYCIASATLAAGTLNRRGALLTTGALNRRSASLATGSLYRRSALLAAGTLDRRSASLTV